VGAVVIFTETWFPICETCPEDATSLVLCDGVWVFHCDVHRGWAGTALRRVWEGWEPDVTGPAWDAALRAVRGVRQPLWMSEVGPDAFWSALEEADEDWVVREDHGQMYAVSC
jgi:hypothetical protein